MPEEKNALDISGFINDTKEKLADMGGPVYDGDGRHYFGKVTFCFENGRITHVEKREVIK